MLQGLKLVLVDIIIFQRSISSETSWSSHFTSNLLNILNKKIIIGSIAYYRQFFYIFLGVSVAALYCNYLIKCSIILESVIST